MNILPNFQSPDRVFQMLQSSWSSIINNVLRNPVIDGVILLDVKLVSGANSVPHTLSRSPQGWIITRFNGSFAQIYDTQDSGSLPGLFLYLNASADTTVNIYVF